MKQTYHDCLPVKTPATNFTFTGSPELDQYTGQKVMELPVAKTEKAIQSTWKCHSIWWRIRFLFNGIVSITIAWQSQPALAVSIGDPLENKNPPVTGPEITINVTDCSACGKSHTVNVRKIRKPIDKFDHVGTCKESGMELYAKLQ